MDNFRNFKLTLFVGVLFLVMVSCGIPMQTGELQQQSTSIPLEGAEVVSANLMMGAGQMNISSGAQALVEADFRYNVSGWEPMVDYSASSEQGILSIEQPESVNLRVDNVRYEWDLRFNPDVVLDMDISLGAGQSTLDFSQLNVTDFDILVGAGEVELDLTGNRQNNMTGTIRGGVGSLTILLPEMIGAAVEVDGGIGSVDTGTLILSGDQYVNAAYGEAETTISLSVEGGVGEIVFQVQN